MTEKPISLPEPNAPNPQDPETVTEQIIAVYGLCRETLSKESSGLSEDDVNRQVKEALVEFGRVADNIRFNISYVAMFCTLVEYSERMMVEVEAGKKKAREELEKEKER